MNLHRPLLAWYAAHHRPLPWRPAVGELADPYAVLVSELMCQQTRVETVLPYYRRWMARWPTLQALAGANVDDVLAMWTGLGYYRRARNLLKAAQQAFSEGGELVGDAAVLARLPGVGRYTAGAVASIGFGLPAALVDGNVARVLARLYAIDTDVTVGPGRRQVWREAEQLMSEPPARADPGGWNQALMELGATICTPKNPSCALCPVHLCCTARQTGRELSLPMPRKRSPIKPVDAARAVISHGGEVLLAKRPPTGRWAGLWEPPGAEGSAAAQKLADAIRPIGELGGPMATFTHVLSHRRYRVAVHTIAARTATELDLSKLDLSTLGYVGLRWSAIQFALSRMSGVSRLGQHAIELAAVGNPN